MKTGLSDDEMARIRAVLEAVPAVEKAVLFGSRAMRLARSNSDVDILLYGDALQTRDVLRAASLLDETTLPYQFDLIRHDASNASLLEHVREYGKVIFQRQEMASGFKPNRKSADMASEWRTDMLGNLTINHDLKRKPVKESDRRPGPYPYYGASGIVDYVEDYLFDGDYLLIAEDGENLRTRQTPIAFMAYGKYWVNNHAHIVTGNEKADTRFLMYAIEGMDISGYLTGAVMPKLTQGNLNKIEIYYPSLPEQRAIAHILGTLDDKIELNRRMNETLEAMARALFKAWFVDFEPVRAKLSGRWRRGQSLPGLPAHLYDLFPDRLVESESGEIPEGWEITLLSEFSTLNPESWTKWTRPEEIHYVDLSNTKWGRIESVMNYEAVDAPSWAQRVLHSLDTIIGTVRPGNGSYALISDEGLTGSTGFAVLRPLRREYSEYVYLAATARENIERLSNLADGGAYPAVRPESISTTQVLRSSQELINEFSKRVSLMIAGIVDNERISHSLTKIRDTLLPKLMRGEIKVSMK